MRRRWIWLVGVPLYLVLLIPFGTAVVSFLLLPPWEEGVFGWLEGTFEALGDGDYLGYAAVIGAIVTATQCLFLAPAVRLRPPSGTRSRSLTWSLLLGAAVAAGLTASLLLGLLELAGGLLHGGGPDANPWGRDEITGELWLWPLVLVTLVGSWLFWTMLLVVFTRQVWPDTVLGRLSVLLLGGTVVELLVVVPVDVMVRRRTDCYCASGTFLALCFSAVAIVWLTGPGIVIALTAKRRRLVRRTHCARCGHPKGPSPGAVCPECGFEWAGEGGRGTPAG